MPLRFKEYSIIFLFGIFFFLRLLHLEESLNFGSDQGLHLLDIYKIYQTKQLTLIGPPSSFVVHGRSFFTGPAPYYILLPLLIIYNWNPLSVSFFLIMLQFLSVYTLFLQLEKKYPKLPIGIFFLILTTFSTIFIEHSRYLWHPNFLIPISLLIITLTLTLEETKRPILVLLAIGFLWGLGMQYHYSFILAISVSLFWLLKQKKVHKTSLGIILVGFLFGFLPIIVFELRHQFYNLRTLLLFIQENVLTGASKPSAYLYYYIFSILPFFYLLLSRILLILQRLTHQAIGLLVGLYILYCLIFILPTPTHGYTMVDGWNYQGVKKVAQIIINDNTQRYNIVDILTGDTRALALRYLLTIEGNPPIGVSEYPQASVIYVYSNIPLQNILTGTLWELDAIRPAVLVKKWDIQSGIKLYRLEKDFQQYH